MPKQFNFLMFLFISVLLVATTMRAHHNDRVFFCKTIGFVNRNVHLSDDLIVFYKKKSPFTSVVKGLGIFLL